MHFMYKSHTPRNSCPHPHLQIPCGLCFTLAILITKIVRFVAALTNPGQLVLPLCRVSFTNLCFLPFVIYKLCVLVLASAMLRLQIPHALYFMLSTIFAGRLRPSHRMFCLHFILTFSINITHDQQHTDRCNQNIKNTAR